MTDISDEFYEFEMDFCIYEKKKKKSDTIVGNIPNAI